MSALNRALVATAVLLLMPAALAAQTRPLVTEEATTAPAGTLVLEAGADFISGEPDELTGIRRERINVPELRLVHSPGDRVELDLEWVARTISRGGPGGTENMSDFGDVTLRAKVLWLDERPGRPALGGRFGVSWAETRFGGLGPNTLRTFAQALATQHWGRAALHADAGVLLFDEPLRPHEQRDFFDYGLAFEWSTGPRTQLLAEIAGLAGKGMPGADQRGEVRAGVRWREKGERRIWDLAFRRGITMATGDWGVTGGVSWTVRRPK